MRREQLGHWLEEGSRQFWRQFGGVFGELAGFGEKDKGAAAAALSNAIGGMGYFHGRLPVVPKDGASPSLPSLSSSSARRLPRRGVPAGGGELSSFPAALFTAVPSRPFFPRGFAWDEGFHQLLIRRWDADIAADSLAHWMGTLHTCLPSGEADEGGECAGMGWLPREQTLGEEARRRVPEEFRKQSPAIANPPTLLLLADALLKASEEQAEVKEGGVDVRGLLSLLRPRLEHWLAWLLASQRATADDAEPEYQWRGRSTDDGTHHHPTARTHSHAR